MMRLQKEAYVKHVPAQQPSAAGETAIIMFPNRSHSITGFLKNAVLSSLRFA